MRPLLVLAVLAVLALFTCDASPFRRQYLPAKPGYIPVYIQTGDEPLEEINLDLAEAFHSIPSGRSANGHDSIMAETNDNEEQPEKPTKHKKHTKRAIDWSQESFGDDDNDSVEFEIQEALSRPDQNYDRSINLQILSRNKDKR